MLVIVGHDRSTLCGERRPVAENLAVHEVNNPMPLRVRIPSIIARLSGKPKYEYQVSRWANLQRTISFYAHPVLASRSPPAK